MVRSPRMTAKSKPQNTPQPEPAAGDAPAETRARTPRRKLGGHTIHDVAALAGVSSITVSRYFNTPDKVSAPLRERITQAVDKTGYVPSQMAGRLAAGRSRVVGAVMQNFASATFADTVQGMTDLLDDSGLQLLLANTNYGQPLEERAIRSFVGWRPSALILTRHDHNPATEALLLRLDIPIVETWDLADKRPFHQVGFSHDAMGVELALHFVTQGARRIRFVLSALPQDFRSRQRANGYSRTMRQHGLKPDVVSSGKREAFAAGAEIMEQFAQEPVATRPQAMVFANDEMAAGAILQAPTCAVILPRDCGICGFGDAPLAAHLHPSLTTMRPDRYAIGNIAAEMVLELIDAGLDAQQAEPRRVVVPCRLIERESARCQLQP